MHSKFGEGYTGCDRSILNCTDEGKIVREALSSDVDVPVLIESDRLRAVARRTTHVRAEQQRRPRWIYDRHKSVVVAAPPLCRRCQREIIGKSMPCNVCGS